MGKHAKKRKILFIFLLWIRLECFGEIVDCPKHGEQPVVPPGKIYRRRNLLTNIPQLLRYFFSFPSLVYNFLNSSAFEDPLENHFLILSRSTAGVHLPSFSVSINPAARTASRSGGRKFLASSLLLSFTFFCYKRIKLNIAGRC